MYAVSNASNSSECQRIKSDAGWCRPCLNGSLSLFSTHTRTPFYAIAHSFPLVWSYLSFAQSFKRQSPKEWFARFDHVDRWFGLFFNTIYGAIWFLLWRTPSCKFRFKMFGKAFDKPFHKVCMRCRHLHIARQICVDVMYTGFGKISCRRPCMSFTTAKSNKNMLKSNCTFFGGRESHFCHTHNSDHP